MRYFIVLVVLASLVFTACVSGMTEEEVRRLIAEEVPTGVPGPAGPQGERGKDGADGRDGKEGAKGERGERGELGERGEQGERGPAGPIGLQGPSGVAGAPGVDGETVLLIVTPTPDSSNDVVPTPTPRPVVTPTPSPKPTPTPTATLSPTQTTGDWFLRDWRSDSILPTVSVGLEAYETGYEEGDATLWVVCFNSDSLGRYLSVSIRWDTYVTILDDRSAHLEWDGGPTEFERWEGSSSGESVSPQFSRTHRHDKAFIARLGQHQHLEFAVESLDGWHRANFNLDGFNMAYAPVAEYCA